MAALVAGMAVAPATAAPFDVYRAACLDTGVDAARIRQAAQAWSALTEADRDVLAPGNAANVEGWAVVRSEGRYLVNLSMRPGGVVTCSVLTPKADEASALKSYSDYLKRPPGSSDRFDGMATHTWSVQGPAGRALHYLVAGGSLPGLSLSVSSIRN